MPDEIVSRRDVTLTKESYERLAGEWRDYADRHPDSAIAMVQLARALRYTGAPIDEVHGLIAAAHHLDPDLPEALAEIAETGFMGEHALATPEEAFEYGRRAIERAPRWPYPHFGLCVNSIHSGLPEQARFHAGKLVEKGGIGEPLLDFGHNLLVSAEPGAMLITNGDNDTFPALAAQATRGVGRDVTVVYVGSLDFIGAIRGTFRTAYGDDGPFTDEELTAFETESKRDTETPLSFIVLRALCEKIRLGEWTKPVCFALTIWPGYLDVCSCEVELEGLLWRVKPAPMTAGAERGMNFEKTARLVREEFRFESAVASDHRWPPGSSVRPIILNYAELLSDVADRHREAGNIEEARSALALAMEILQFHGKDEEAAALRERMP